MASTGPSQGGWKVNTAGDQARRMSKRFSTAGGLPTLPSIPQDEEASSAQMRRASKRFSTGSSFAGVKSDFSVPVVLNDEEKRLSRRVSALPMPEPPDLNHGRSEGAKRDSNRVRSYTEGARRESNRMSFTDGARRDSNRMSFGDPTRRDSNSNRMSVQNKRQSRRLSTLSDLSDVDMESRRASRNMSTFATLEGDKRRSMRMSMLSAPTEASFADRATFMRTSRADWAQPVEIADIKDWPSDPQNATNWKTQSKVINTIVVSVVAFACTFSSSIYAPAQQLVMARMHTTGIVSILPYSLYILGLGLGPMIGGPFASLFGQKAALLTCMPLYAIFTLVSGFDTSIVGLIIFHFLAGAFAGPGLFVGASVVSDIWFNSQQGTFMSLYVMFLFLGLPLGPLIGGYVIEHMSWRWAEWLPLIAIFISLFGVFGLSETHKATILRRRDRLAWQQAESEREIPRKFDNWPLERREAIGKTFRNTSTMAIVMLMQPMTGLFSLYTAFTFAVLFSFFIMIPVLFPAIYGLDTEQQGYTFAGMVIGIVIAFALVHVVTRVVYEPRLESWKAEQASSTEELLEKEGAKVAVTDVETKKNYRTSFTRNLEAFPAPKGNGRAVSYGRRSRANTMEKTLLETPIETALEAPVSAQAISVANDASRYINAQPGNENNQINPDNISAMLNTTDTFAAICANLDQQGLKFDNGDLAKVIVDALGKKSGDDAEEGGQEPPIARSQSLHREAAIAALSNPHPLENVPAISTNLTPSASDTSDPAPVVKKPLPPAEWRLLPALPASIIMPASLFMFGWTLRSSIPWIVPVIAMSLYAMSCMLIYLAVASYTTELFEAEVAERARAGRGILTFVLSAVFPLFVRQMYSSLGVPLATSIFGAVAVVLGFVPWVYVLFGENWRKATAGEKAGSEDDEKRQGVVIGSWYRWSGRARQRLSGKPREIKARSKEGLASVWE